eukprot:m.127911 g.127911  ORF g.127911 m.127911 type:complete len:245 (-) comp19879_c0_seq1:41-775(-)
MHFHVQVLAICSLGIALNGRFEGFSILSFLVSISFVFSLFSAADFASCTTLRSAVANVQSRGLAGLPFPYLAAWADSLPSYSGEWVAILQSEQASEANASHKALSCSAIPFAHELTVLYTKQGSHNNPQLRIVGAELSRHTATWTFTAGGNESMLPFAVYDTARFVHVDDGILANRRKRRKIVPGARCSENRCLEDAFYPLQQHRFQSDLDYQSALAYGLLLLIGSVLVMTVVWLPWPLRSNAA